MRELNEKVVVMGAGNGGQALAADLSLAGYNVNLYEHSAMVNKFKVIIEKKEIEFRTPQKVQVASLSDATCDLEQALDGIKIINIVVPSNIHETFFNSLIPFLTKEHKVIVWSGRFGAMRLNHMCEQRNVPIPTIVEVNTLPYGSRLVSTGIVQILFTAKKLYYAPVTQGKLMEIERLFNHMFPVAKNVENPMAVALNNSALLVLPIAPIFNVGAIERLAGDFYLFRDGITHSVGGVMEVIYYEIKGIADKLGFSLTQYRSEDFTKKGSVEAVNFEVEGGDVSFYEKMSGPDKIKHRYLMENIPFGLVPLSELGKLTGVPTPAIDSIIELGSILCRTNFRQEGRSLLSLGIKQLSDLK